MGNSAGIAAVRPLLLALVASSALPSGAAAATWAPDHIVIVIEENLLYRHLMPELTYLTRLAHDNASFTDSHGVDHPSQPNYLALFSGSTQGTGSKRNPDGSNPIVGGHTQVGKNTPVAGTPLTAPNLGASLIRAGRSFAGYWRTCRTLVSSATSMSAQRAAASTISASTIRG